MSATVTLLTRLQARDESAATALAGMLGGLAGSVPSEPGNVFYEVYQTDEDRSVFYISERWSTSEDAARHIQLIAADPVSRRSAALLAAPLVTATLTPLSVSGTSRAQERSTS